MKTKNYKSLTKKVLFSSLIFLSYMSVYSQTDIWSGAVDQEWTKNENWLDNTVPDNTVDVIIQSGLINYPVINQSGESCKSLTFQDGAALSLCTGSDLTVNGDLIVGENVTGNLTGLCGTLNITGQLILESNAELILSDIIINPGSVSLSSGSTVTYSGNNTEIYNWNYGNLVLNGTGEMKITGDAVTPSTCVNLTINATGNILRIPANKALTVTGSLTNNAGNSGILIESNSLGDGSLILNSSGTSAHIQRYLTGERWHYLSSPIANADAEMFNLNNLIWWDASMEWTGPGDYLPWKSVSDPTLQNATGYAYWFDETTLLFSGSINSEDIMTTLYSSNSGNSEYQGWNMIGNPYSSVLSWDNLVADGGISEDIESAVYFFDDDAQNGDQCNYRYYVPSTGGTYGIGTEDANGNIPLGQGFFVKTNVDNVPLHIKKSYRIHNNQEYYKNDIPGILKIRLSDSEISDQFIGRIVNDATYDFDSRYDARKMLVDDPNFPQVYGLDIKGELKMAINSIPELTENSEINLGIKAAKGYLTFNLEEYNFDHSKLYLFDKELDLLSEFKKGDSYSFYHNGGENMDRFVLIFKNISTGNELPDRIEFCIYPNPAADEIQIIESKGNNIKKLQITTLNGLEIMSKYSFSEKTVNLSNLKTGIYFVSLEFENGKKSVEKLLIQK